VAPIVSGLCASPGLRRSNGQSPQHIGQATDTRGARRATSRTWDRMSRCQSIRSCLHVAEAKKISVPRQRSDHVFAPLICKPPHSIRWYRHNAEAGVPGGMVTSGSDIDTGLKTLLTHCVCSVRHKRSRRTRGYPRSTNFTASYWRTMRSSLESTPKPIGFRPRRIPVKCGR
jgi:hypothetical protein